MDNDSSRRLVEHCYRTTSTMISPIIDWKDEDVWTFLHYYGCNGNPLYQCGESRIGCIGCPLQQFKGMKADFVKYPKYKQLYINAFDRMVKARIESGLYVDESWRDGEHVMKWWLGDDPNQLSLFDDI